MLIDRQVLIRTHIVMCTSQYSICLEIKIILKNEMFIICSSENIIEWYLHLFIEYKIK